MHTHFTPPPPDLLAWTSGAVAVAWDEGDEGPAESCFPASVGGMLVVRLRGRTQSATGELLPAVALIGPSVRPLRLRQAGAVRACGLLLAPQAVAGLARRPNRWTVGEVLDLSALHREVGRRLQATLAQAPTAAEQCARLFDALRTLLALEPRRGLPAADAAALPGLLAQGLDAACRGLGVGARQLERRCKEALGMSPQQAFAVLRMEAALRSAMQVQAPRPGGGAELALGHRYYDQAHLGRDLRRLAGAPLTRLVAAAQAPVDEFWAFSVGRQREASASVSPRASR